GSIWICWWARVLRCPSKPHMLAFQQRVLHVTFAGQLRQEQSSSLSIRKPQLLTCFGQVVWDSRSFPQKRLSVQTYRNTIQTWLRFVAPLLVKSMRLYEESWQT